MSDHTTPPDGHGHSASTPPTPGVHGAQADRLRALVDAALADGPPVEDPADPLAGGIRLGAALKASGIQFRVTFDPVAPGLAHLTVTRTAIERVAPAGVDADPVDAGDGRTSYLLTGPQCHALAASIESTWGDGPRS